MKTRTIEEVEDGVKRAIIGHEKQAFTHLIYGAVIAIWARENNVTMFVDESIQLAELISWLRKKDRTSLQLKTNKDDTIEINGRYIISELEKWANSLLNEVSNYCFQDLYIERKVFFDDTGLSYCEPYTDEELEEIIKVEKKTVPARLKEKRANLLTRKPNKDNVYPGMVLTTWYREFENAGMFAAKKTNKNDNAILRKEYYLLYDCMVALGKFDENVAYEEQKFEKVRDCIKAYKKYQERNPEYTGKMWR